MTTEQEIDILISEKAQELWAQAGRQGNIYRNGSVEELRFYEYQAEEKIGKEKGNAYLPVGMYKLQ